VQTVEADIRKRQQKEHLFSKSNGRKSSRCSGTKEKALSVIQNFFIFVFYIFCPKLFDHLCHLGNVVTIFVWGGGGAREKG
jgi:hypothetical protein